MGLDFSHGEAQWSYSGFGQFRRKLAKEIGIEDLNTMEGFKSYAKGNSWEPYEKDPLYPLLSHSDCDGELTVEECLTIAPVLRKKLEGWPDSDFDKIRGLRLCDSMELAAKENQPLEFR